MFILLLTSFAQAQTSQFLFDPNGNLTLQMAAATAPPQILGQPQTQMVAPGESTAFSVVVADPRSLTYQWRYNGANLGGETGVSLVLDNVNTNNEGAYDVVLTNPSGSVTSAPAMLWIDSREVGMPNSWQLAYFGNLSQLPNGDFDGDGSSNLQEFLDGTDPTNTNSVRYHLTVVRDGGSVTRIPDQVSYTNGESVTLTAIAPSNELFHAWLGDVVSRDNPLTLVMTSNKTVYARFTPIGFTWTNVASGNWEGAANWTPNLVPGTNDSVIINKGVTVTLNTNADCLDFTFGEVGPATPPTLTGSGALTVRGNLLWSAGTMSITGTLLVQGNFSWLAGTMSGVGRTVLETNAYLSLSIANTVNLFNRTLENRGTILLAGDASFAMANGATITNCPGGLFDVRNAVTIGGGNISARIDNSGTFRKSVNSGTTTFNGSPSSMSFNNYGVVEIQSGTLQCSVPFTNQGAVTLSPGTTNRVAAGGAGGGTFDAPAGALVEWTSGAFTLSAGAQLNGAGLYRLNGGNLTAAADLTVKNLDLVSGNSTLGGTGVVTIAGAMNWTAGTMSGSGRTIIDSGATLNLSGTSGVSLGRTLENAGTVLWTAGSVGLGVITNRPGALFEVRNSASVNFFAASPRFDNAGTFRKSVSSGTTTINPNFTNYGTLEIQSGTLLCSGSFGNSGAVNLSAGATHRLAGGGVATGTFDAPSSSLVEWTGGTFPLSGGAQLNGSGQYKINGGTLVAGINLAVQNLDLAVGALDGAGIVTISNVMNWSGGSMSGSGRTLIAPAATLNINNSSQIGLTTRALENAGTTLWTGAGGIALTAAAITNRVGALFHAQNAATIGSISTTRFDNAGTFRKSINSGTATLNVNFTNYGTVEVQSGTFTCGSPFANKGVVNLSGGTTVRLAGGGTSSGLFDTPTGALMEWTVGSFTLNSGAQLNGAGHYRINGGNLVGNTNLTVENLDLLAGSLDGTNTVTIAQAMSWSGGSLSGSGRTIISPPASLNINSPSPSGLSISSRTLENGGTTIWTGAGNISMSVATITNRAAAVFQVQNSASLVAFGTSRFDNTGTLRKSGNSGTTSVASGIAFNNFGTVDLRSGILLADGGYISAANALLNCALGGTTAGTGYGQLQVAGSVTLNGALSVDLINGFVPATNNTFAVLTAGTRNASFASFSYPSNLVTMQLSNSPTSVVIRVTDVLTSLAPPTLLMPEIIGSNINLTWTAVSNISYRLEFNPDLTSPGNWIAVPGDITAITNSASKLDPLTSSNRFYRVLVLP